MSVAEAGNINPANNRPQTPKLSIILTSTSPSRLGDLRLLIDSISKQDERNLEVIFVAENSVRLLDEVRALSEMKGLPGSFLLNEGTHGLSQARNLGLTASRAPILAMIDDDVLLPENWARAVLETFAKDNGIIGMTGPAYPLWGDRRMSWLPQEFYWLISCSDWFDFTNPSDVRSAWGSNMAFRREAFSLAGRFSETSGFHKVMAEDLEFSIRVRKKTGMRIAFSRDAFLWHRVHPYRLQWWYVRERSQHIGISRYALTRLGGIMMDRENTLVIRMIRKIPGRIGNSPRFGFKIAFLSAFVFLNIFLGYLMASLGLNGEIERFLAEERTIMQFDLT